MYTYSTSTLSNKPDILSMASVIVIEGDNAIIAAFIIDPYHSKLLSKPEQGPTL